MIKKNIKYSLLLVILFSSPFLAQSQDSLAYNKCYSDFHLDYFPHFKTWRIEGELNVNVIRGLDFDDVLQDIINSCSSIEYKLRRFSGWTMYRSGMLPKPLEKAVWFAVEIDKFGHISFFEVYNSVERETIKSCFLESTISEIINPGLIDHRPITCRMFYILE